MRISDWSSDVCSSDLAADLARLAPIPLAPSEVTDADWVLITHDHIDHCDPHTLPALAAASPRARFMGPPSVLGLLARWGIAAERLEPASEEGGALSPGVAVVAVPAAHPELARDEADRPACLTSVFAHHAHAPHLPRATNAHN